MEILLADERAWLLEAQISMDHAEGRAWGKKVDAFGRAIKLTSFLQRPKDEDFKLVYKEQRYQPFWHVVCSARYVYERRRDYPLTIGDPAVKAVTIQGAEYPVQNGLVTLTGLEHCREELRKDVFVDGLTNQVDAALVDYLTYPVTEIPADDLDEFAPEGVIVVPPLSRASAVVHEVLIGMIKSVQAERILEDSIEVEQIDLYYRPVFAFQYGWLSKEKEAVLEYDGVTGKWQSEGKTFQQYVGKIIDPDFLFDVGAETVDLLVPGGGLAIKLAKRGIEVARGRGGR
jgi:hypothetical protein